MTWEQFATQLGDKLDEHRAKQAFFAGRQLVWFITDCSQLFNNPKTPEAEASLNAIREEGTFVIVANSFTEFLGMFPGYSDGEQAPECEEQEAEENPATATSKAEPARDQDQVRSARRSGRSFRR